MPITLAQHEKKLQEPALCELLPVRDYLDNVIVRTNGAFVAGYELRGLTSYFASDEGRDREKLMLEAMLRSIPEQSMRVQIRYADVRLRSGTRLRFPQTPRVLQIPQPWMYAELKFQ